MKNREAIARRLAKLYGIEIIEKPNAHEFVPAQQTTNCGQVLPTLIVPPQFFQGTLKTIDRTNITLDELS